MYRVRGGERRRPVQMNEEHLCVLYKMDTCFHVPQYMNYSSQFRLGKGKTNVHTHSPSLSLSLSLSLQVMWWNGDTQSRSILKE